VAFADCYPAVAAGAEVPLAGGIGLHGGGDLNAERAAHRTSDSTAAGRVPVAMAESVDVVRSRRDRLNPIGAS